MQIKLNLLDKQMQQTDNNTIFVERLLNISPKSKIAKLQSWKIHKSIFSEIRRGNIQIQETEEDFDTYINHQIKQDSLKRIYHSQDFYNYERDYKIMLGLSDPVQQTKKRNRKVAIKQEEILNKRKSDEEIKREFLKKLKNWEQQKSRIAKRKQQIQMKKQLLENSSQDKRKKQQEEINAFLKLQKQKIIQAKIRDIQDRKAKRHQVLQQSAIRRNQSVPIYVEYQNRYKNKELKKNLEEKILLNNRRHSLELKLQEIKQHQKAYIQRIKERLKINSQNNKSLEKSNKVQQSFNINKKNPDQIKKNLQKIKRIQKFEKKLRLLPLKIDQQKQKEALIMKDKLKNRKKYLFLSQKALSDEQIYQQFKQFDINIDNKQIGNQYFEQFKKQNKKHLQPHRKGKSQKILPKKQYKNYLEDIRSKKKQILNPDEFQTYASKIKGLAYKQQGKEFLRQKSQLYQNKAIEKIMQLKKMDRYPDSIKKQQEIDQHYAKALKAKIALAKLE